MTTTLESIVATDGTPIDYASRPSTNSSNLTSDRVWGYLVPRPPPVSSPILGIQEEDYFHLSDGFIEEFKDRQPKWGPVGYITYKRTYARPLDDGETEEYWQTCQRVVEGVYTIQKWHCHRSHLPWSDSKAQASAQEMYRLMWGFKFLPPGRGLWMMGADYVRLNGGAALNNCAFVSTANIGTAYTHPADIRMGDPRPFSDPFTFLMDMSMLGVGVGGDTLGAGKVTIQEPLISATWHQLGREKYTRDIENFEVEDTREGWVHLIRLILDSYVGAAPLLDNIDYSKVRPEGTPIKSFGGIAAGPEPLKRCVAEIKAILDPLIGQPITAEAIVDLFNVIGVCVVSGNVRRSAEIMLGKPDDDVFLNLKNPEVAGDKLMTHRWASNNSILAEKGQDYDDIASRIAKNGEPGLFWLESARAYGRMKDGKTWADTKAEGTNPCSEQTLESFELCCLVETFPSLHESYEEYERTLKYAYLYAKTVTLIPTHQPMTNAVMMRNRRIGTSQSGIVQSFARHGRKQHFDWCDNGYDYLKELDFKYSNWLAIPRSIKITSVKPSGTVSLLPGVTPGIHYEHSEYYFRTIRIAKSSLLLAPLKKAGYRVEEDAYDKSSSVVYFPVHAEYFDRSKDDVTIWEQLENAAQMQYYWADNQVSVTVTFKPREKRDISRALELYQSRLKSVSFLPAEDHGYVQAPYITITKDEYEEAASKIKPLKLSGDTNEMIDAYCDGDACLIPQPGA